MQGSQQIIDIKKQLIKQMYDVGCFKSGSFTLKSGKKSDFYIDLRDLTLHPELLWKAGELISEIVLEKLSIDKETLVCGIPYGAVPVATVVAQQTKTKMLMIRKKPKQHGRQKQIEGLDNLGGDGSGYKCILIDDVITSGVSIRETCDILRENSKLIVTDAVVLIDREDSLRDPRINCHAVFTLSEIKEVLQSYGIQLQTFSKKTFEERSAMAHNQKAKELFKIMSSKKTNLIVAIDEVDIKKVYDITSQLAESVCAVKFHADTWINNESEINEWKQKIHKVAENHNFLIFEDRKFSDIGNTVLQQYNYISKKYESINLVTVVPIFGEGTITTLKAACEKSHGQFIVREGSSSNNLFNENYSKKCTMLGMRHSDCVTGFICQKRTDLDEDMFIYATPGVHLSETNDLLDQKYRTPEDAIIRDNCDVIIVGRGITQSNDIKATADKYSRESYRCYLQKVNAE